MIAVLGWVGSALLVVSLTQRNVRRLRQLNLAASIVLGIFNRALGIASMIALNAVLAAVNRYHVIGWTGGRAPLSINEQPISSMNPAIPPPPR